MTGSGFDLEQRLRRLEDREALLTLKHRYCEACDAGYDPDALADLFTADATWDGGPLGRASGREGIRAYFAAAGRRVPFALHYVTNPSFGITAHEARCSWYLWQPMVMRDFDDALWYAARYDDLCVRGDEGWRFQSVSLTARMLSPYRDGFADTRILDLRTLPRPGRPGKDGTRSLP